MDATVFLILWSSCGLSHFLLIKRYALGRGGFVPAAYIVAFIGCLIAWPAFGLYALVAPANH